ncbi:MAG TPA: glutamate--tRNA ligase [Candidatus Saccharimonadales bacterium]
MNTIRTRFAPSPTGFMHVGNLRTGLFAWLTARNSGGQFILRLEDTDKNREVEGSADHILKCLDMLGLDRDEGLDVGGPYAPYKQSERLDVYKAWAQKLIDAGRAYADPYTPAEVQSFREQAQQAKKPFLYRNHRPENPPVWDGTTPLRFKAEPKEYQWHDEVMGDLHTGPEVIDDFILIKSDGYPTYNFAHIVDDAEMQITHVIRGQEFISSTPNYLNLYEALGLERPIFATMPHIMNEQGNKKLGKRDGAKDVLEYVHEGFLPETLLSFIATLGWNDGTEQEVFTREELIEKFSLSRVQKSGARFDEKRLLWMNGTFIRELPLDELYTRCQAYWPPEAADASDDYKKQVLALVQERLKYFAELPELSNFFFVDLAVDPKLISDHKQLKKLDATQLKHLLGQVSDTLEQSDFTPEDIQTRLNQLLESTGEKPAVLFSLVRIATTQAPASPGLADTLAVLGKTVSIRRIQAQLAAL